MTSVFNTTNKTLATTSRTFETNEMTDYELNARHPTNEQQFSKSTSERLRISYITKSKQLGQMFKAQQDPGCTKQQHFKFIPFILLHIQ